MQAVALAPSTKAIGAFQKFETNADSPLGRNRNEVRHALKMKALRVLPTYHHSEGIFEAQRLGDFKIESVAVKLLYPLVHRGGIASRTFVKNRIERRAGVLNVKVHLTGLHRFMDQQGAAKICFAFHVDAGASFNVLRE